MRKLAIAILAITAALVSSCTKTMSDYPNLSGNTATAKMSNGWWVNVTVSGQPGNLLPKPVFFQTYNTSSNSPDSLWLDDVGNFWNFKIVAVANYSTLSFKANGVLNDYYADTAIIMNGKILPKAAHSRTGNVTDSIYMEAQFSDDSPAYGNTYIIAGTARTSFIEDDY
jgi:hypothetical protein